MNVKLSRTAQDSGFVPVCVDPEKITRDWTVNNSRLQRVSDYINNVVEKGFDKFELPEAWFSTVLNSLQILNGKHRITEIVNRGGDLWIAVPEPQAEMIERRFGYSNSKPIMDAVDPNLTAWSQGDYPNPPGETKTDGPGIMPTKPASADPKDAPKESTSAKPKKLKAGEAGAPKLNNKRCGESFIPDDEICHENEVKPEKVVAAAIKVNGKTYTGPMHVFAAIAAHAAGEFPGMQDLNGLEDVKHLIQADGFLTSHGRFITREQAFDLAHKNGQVEKSKGFHGAGRLGSEDLDNAVAQEYEKLNNGPGVSVLIPKKIVWDGLTGDQAMPEALRISRTLFGAPWPVSALLKASGAKPGDPVTLRIHNGTIEVYVTTKGVGVVMGFKESTPRAKLVQMIAQESGKGFDVFCQIVDELAYAGFDSIEMDADRGEALNGYYTWPRLGAVSEPDARMSGTVQDLMQSEEGRAWWKENGFSIPVRFDLEPGTYSRTVFDAYRKAKQ